MCIRDRLDEDLTYTRAELDNDVVNPSQIRTVIRTFKERLPEMFPDRLDEKGNLEVPKTCLLYTSPSPRDRTRSRMPSSA